MAGGAGHDKSSRGSIVGGSPSNSIATKKGGQTFAKGGKGVGKKSGNSHGPKGRKM